MNRTQESLKRCLSGTIEARVYGEDGRLKRVHRGSNVVTTLGINRLVDMLIDGYNQTYPKYYGDWASNSWQRSTLHNEWDFNGGMDGELFGVNILEWTGRYKSTWLRSSTYLSQITNYDYMFNNNKFQYSDFYSSSNNGNGYWTPSNNEQTGWIMDMGLTDVVAESFVATNLSSYFNLVNKNLKYGSVTVQNNTRTITYVKDTDYYLNLGDGDNYGSIKLINPALVDATLKVSYSWFDVPQVPIVGFAIDMCSPSNGIAWHADFRSFRWSLDQGQTRTHHMFPNRAGIPNNGWQSCYGSNDWPTTHAISWNSSEYMYTPKTFFFNSLPWAVKNPTQMAWYGQNYNYSKWVYEFQLLGYKMPKMGAHAIALGTGNGSPSASDTALFSPSITKVTQSKSRNGGTSALEIKAYLDFSEGNGVTFTEAGLMYPSNDSVYFKDDTYWMTGTSVGGAGTHSDHISGTNKILKLSALASSDFDKLASHAMYETPWSKNSAERVELVYTLNVGW